MHLTGDDIWIDENTRADDAAHDDHRRVEGTEAAGEGGHPRTDYTFL